MVGWNWKRNCTAFSLLEILDLSIQFKVSVTIAGGTGIASVASATDTIL